MPRVECHLTSATLPLVTHLQLLYDLLPHPSLVPTLAELLKQALDAFPEVGTGKGGED